MLFIALRRLWARLFLTLLSIAGVTLAVGLVTAIPIFSRAVSFVVLMGELREVSARSGRPLFALRVYTIPTGQYPLSVEQSKVWEDHITDTVISEVGLPMIARQRHLESTGLNLHTKDEVTPYGELSTFLREDFSLVVLPGVEEHLDIVAGEPMDSGVSSGDELDVWLHKTMADDMGIQAGEQFQVRNQRGDLSIPIRITGLWQATDPRDGFWFSNPDLTLRGELLTREEDYEALVEPLFQEQLGFVSWYLVLDDSPLVPEDMRLYADGLDRAFKIIAKFVPDSRVDASPIDALANAVHRETNLTALLFVFSVPLIGFLLYFLALMSSITIRWERRETSIMVSRGMGPRHLSVLGLIETTIIVGIGCASGILLGIQLAQVMGYARSFMSFTWRQPLPISPTAFSISMIALVVIATSVARLWPTLRFARTSVVAYERRRARAPEQPFWQRLYLDFALLLLVLYAYRQLSRRGTLVPEALTESGQGGTFSLLEQLPESFRNVVEFLGAVQDPLLFLVPAFFTLACSLILVRLFPLLMRFGDWLGGLGRDPTWYLAFRQLSRQSNQYVSALLLVITSLSLGAFMASMAISLDRWLTDQVYYAVGSDVYIRQLPDPDAEIETMDPESGAWILPIEDYLEVPGVTAAARVGRYPASLSMGERRVLKGTFIGIDRLDVPGVIFYRPDFRPASLGEMTNMLATREDAVLLSEKTLAQSDYQLGDKIHIRVRMWVNIHLERDFTIVGTYKYFPTVYEDRDQQSTVIGNLDHLFEQIGATMMHDIWLRVKPDADRDEMVQAVENMGVHIHSWMDVRELMIEEQAKVERVGIFGTLTIGFLAAAVLSGIGLLVYNYASLQERIFRFTILRAEGLSLVQVVVQVTIEYTVLMVYSVLGGAAVGIWASRLFVPFFQAADRSVLNPPMLIPLIAWEDIARITAAFAVTLVVAQVAVIAAALRRGVFQALRMGDRE